MLLYQLQMERKPHREYLYRRAREAMRERTFDTVVDVACGDMQASEWMSCERYIGVDLDAERLSKGLARGPGREAVHSRMEDMPRHVRGDLVLCFEAIGVNEHAHPGRSLAYVKRLIEATFIGGMLLLNTGGRAAPWTTEITGSLDRNFERVEVIRYGRFGPPKWRPISSLLASMMMRWPHLAVTDSRELHLYIADGRRHPTQHGIPGVP